MYKSDLLSGCECGGSGGENYCGRGGEGVLWSLINGWVYIQVRRCKLSKLKRYGSGSIALLSAAIFAMLVSAYSVVLFTSEISPNLIFGVLSLSLFVLVGWGLLRLSPFLRTLGALLLIAACVYLLPHHNCGSENKNSVGSCRE